MSLPVASSTSETISGRVPSPCDGAPCASDRTSHTMLSPAKFQRGSTVAMSPARKAAAATTLSPNPAAATAWASVILGVIGLPDCWSPVCGAAKGTSWPSAQAMRSTTKAFAHSPWVEAVHCHCRASPAWPMSTRAAGSPVAPSRQPRPRVAARLAHEEGREVRSGWLVTAHPIGAFRLAQLSARDGVREGIEPAPALERANVPSGIRAGWVELLVVAGDRDGLTVQLARPQQLDGMSNADHRQAGDLGWERRVGRLACRQR